MIRHLFTEHPRSVGESYVEHAAIAARFGGTMVAGGLACLVHAVVPALFTRTGSDTVRRLHARMVPRGAAATERTDSGDWQLTYVI